MSEDLEKLRDRLRFAVNMLRDAKNTAALIRQGRDDATGTRSTNLEQHLWLQIEGDLADRRVRAWTTRVSELTQTAEFFGFGIDSL